MYRALVDLEQILILDTLRINSQRITDVLMCHLPERIISTETVYQRDSSVLDWEQSAQEKSVFTTRNKPAITLVCVQKRHGVLLRSKSGKEATYPLVPVSIRRSHTIWSSTSSSAVTSVYRAPAVLHITTCYGMRITSTLTLYKLSPTSFVIHTLDAPKPCLYQHPCTTRIGQRRGLRCLPISETMTPVLCPVAPVGTQRSGT